MRLSTRFALMAGVAVPVLVLLAGAGMLSWAAADLRAERDARLHARASALTQVFGQSTADRQLTDVEIHALVAAGGSEEAVEVAAPVGWVRFGETLPAGGLPASDGAFSVREGLRFWRGYSTLTGQGRVWVLESSDVLSTKLSQLGQRVLFLGLLAVPVAVGAGMLLGQIATRPLRLLQRRAGSVGDRFGGRVALRTRITEIDEVAEVLDAALARRDAQEARTVEALRAARSFAAAAAHELRNPLMSMQANVDTLAHPEVGKDDQREALADLRVGQERMLSLLEVLRALSHAELAGPERFAAVDLVELAERAIDEAGLRHPRTSFALTGPDVLVVHAWSEGLRMMLDNLLDNAAVHGRPGNEPGSAPGQVPGQVPGQALGSAQVDATATVRLTLSAVGQVAGGTPGGVAGGVAGGGAVGVVLTVDDDGPGIAPSLRTTVFDRFQRGGDSPGSGLGLTLVREVALRHGGDAIIDTPPSGRGTRVRVLVQTPAAHKVFTRSLGTVATPPVG